ncbi:Leucine-rich repeat [Dillenia turbinata]|uniref:Leucine-rich repeat n=1 Tax=Dillenia turbinata TaxID=194707 RepID=A0AAN8YSJ1_9MAGN
MRLVLGLGCFLLFLFYFGISIVYCLSSNGKTLLSLVSNWSLPPSLQWKASDSFPCMWVGVECDLHTYHVISLNLSNFKISDNLNMLQNLRFLNFHGNSLSGPVPNSLFLIPHLQSIYLSENKLTSSIPEIVGNLSEVVSLWLYGYQFSGTIPSSAANCSNLQELYLNDNQFVGVLPENLNKLENLVYLDVSSNSMRGAIPMGLGKCKCLDNLFLSFNSFSGQKPAAFGNCSSLTAFAALSNNLTGRISTSFGLLNKLSILYLSENRLSGTVPPELGNCKSLQSLKLNDNQLEGTIPSELPLQLSKLIQLKNVSLYNKHFLGIIPQDLGIHSSLVQLDFTNNSFTGTIPPHLCFRKQLKVLNMGFNNLSGGIPSDVGNCSSLKRLRLQKNNFTGVLPEFFNNPDLLFMDISENNIHGTIPSSLGNCRNLTSINLSTNKLTGVIPQEIGKLSNLQQLNLSHNNLEGPLPSQLVNCTNLFEIDVGFNSLNGSFPSIFDKLSEIQLGGNLFGGNIPLDIGGLQNLIYALNLSNNGLIGELPLSMGKLIRLQILDISRNNLTGTLTDLDGTHSLIEINISDNNFSGPVPESLMTCDPPPVSGKGPSKLQIAMIALGSTISSVLVVLGLGFIILRWKRPKREAEISSQGGSSATLKMLMESTENLNQRFIIGTGAHGTVYKATLGEEKIFAIKKFSLVGQKALSKSMVREIQTLAMIRYRNLVKLQDFWLRRDPENAFTTAKGKESDVCSYRVVLLELITRRQALDSSFGEETEIVGWVRSVWRNSQDIKRIVDPSLGEELLDTSIMVQVVSVFFVALRCTEKKTNLRPIMRDAVKQLIDANSLIGIDVLVASLGTVVCIVCLEVFPLSIFVDGWK